RVGNQPAGGRHKLGQRIRPSFGEAMAGQVDDDGVGRRLELDVTADEDERSAGSECLGVGYEAGDTAVTVAREARVERRSRLSGVRVAAERKQLEIGMREDAIERL